MTKRGSKKDLDRPSKKYIRTDDIQQFNKSEYSTMTGVILTKYYGTLRKAWEKGVPVYDKRGKLTHKPSVKANPKRS